MSAQQNESKAGPVDATAAAVKADKSAAISGSASEIELEIQARRDHLASTIDELASRAKPKEIARRTAAGVQQKVRSFTHTDDGQLRSERLGAIGGAIAVVAGLMALIRRRH